MGWRVRPTCDCRRMTTNDDRGTVAEIMKETRTAVLTYVSLAGDLVSMPMGMQDFDDTAKLKELWDASAGAFMSGGPEDPDNVLLRIDGATAEYWENPGKVAIAVQMAKGLVTDSEPDLGDNDTVALWPDRELTGSGHARRSPRTRVRRRRLAPLHHARDLVGL